MKCSYLLIGTSLLSLVSCGGGHNGGSVHKSSSPQRVERQEDTGRYRAVLSPLNASVAGETSGTVEVTIEADDFIAEATVSGAPAGVKHLQSIMTGSRCPDSSQDLNHDGIIDMAEAISVLGNTFIPLDSNLKNQILGMDYGPIANGEGAYVYHRSTSFSVLLADLRDEDPDTQDLVVKLPLDQDINLAGKTVVIQGASSEAQSLPIACGTLVRISE